MPWVEHENRIFAAMAWRLQALERALDTISESVIISVAGLCQQDGRTVTILYRNSAALEAEAARSSTGGPKPPEAAQLTTNEVVVNAESFEMIEDHHDDSAAPDSAASKMKLTISTQSSISPLRNPSLRAVLDSAPLDTFVCLPDAGVEWISKSMTESSGWSVGDVSGHEWHPMMHPADLEFALAAWDTALRTGIFPGVDIRLASAGGEDPWRYYSCVVRAMRDPASGELLRWIGMLTDLHERRMLEQKLEAEKALFETAIDQLPIAMFVVEAPSGAMRLANKPNQELWGLNTGRVPERPELSNYGQFVAYHPGSDGRRYAAEDWPISRAILHGETTVKEDALFERR